MPDALPPWLLMMGRQAIPATAEFLYAGGNTSSGTSFTFSSVSFGVANATRIIAVYIAYGNNNAVFVTGVSIGGVAATLSAGSKTPDGAIHGEFWYAAVPSGTSGSIVVTCGATQLRMNIASWAVYNGIVATGYNDTSSPFSVSANVPDRGVVLAGVYNEQASTYTFTGVDEDFDQGVYGFGATHGGGHREYATGGASTTIAVALSGTPDHTKFCALVFGPVS